MGNSGSTNKIFEIFLFSFQRIRLPLFSDRQSRYFDQYASCPEPSRSQTRNESRLKYLADQSPFLSPFKFGSLTLVLIHPDLPLFHTTEQANGPRQDVQTPHFHSQILIKIGFRQPEKAMEHRASNHHVHATTYHGSQPIRQKTGR